MDVVITRAARKGLENAPAHVQDKFANWVRTVRLFGLTVARKNPSYHDEPLRGQRQGQRSIRLNRQWRAIYMETAEQGIVVTVLEVQPMTTEHDKYEIHPDDQVWLDAQIAGLTFGRCLKAHRLCGEWTQEQTAQKLGISKQMYNAYEKDRKLPTPKKAYEMAEILGMVPESLALTVLNDQLKRDELPFRVSVAG